VLLSVVGWEGLQHLPVGPVEPVEEEEVGASLDVRKARQKFVEDLHLADLLRGPPLEGGLGPGLVWGVDYAYRLQVHGEVFGCEGKKGLRGMERF